MDLHETSFATRKAFDLLVLIYIVCICIALCICKYDEESMHVFMING